MNALPRIAALLLLLAPAAATAAEGDPRLAFDGSIPRDVLERYLARSITMEGLLHGRGDLADDTRMLHAIGARFVGRAACLWGNESRLLDNLDRIRASVPQVRAEIPDVVLQACIFEIVTTEVEAVAIPAWAFEGLGRPVETRKFRYADMLYPDGQFVDHWRKGQSVPDVSRPETELWFYFLGRSFIDAGIESIHLGQTELMNHNDRDLAHYAAVLDRLRSYAHDHARRHIVLFDSHVPSGGLVRDGRLLMDFHAFPLRIKEVPDKPRQAILELGFSDGIYNRSKGGITPSGWTCEHLPYLAEIDNWGVSGKPGEPRQGGIWIWGWDEITWFANQPPEARAAWLQYAWNWVRQTDPNGFLEMPGGRGLSQGRGHEGPHWYHANNRSDATPGGFGDEGAIRRVWQADTGH